MNELEEARKIIDEVDPEIARLFEKRMHAVKQVATYKASHGIPIFDAEREKKVLEKDSKYIQDPELVKYYLNQLQNLMDESKKYQEALLSGMAVAYCGVEGAFGNIASGRIFPGARLISYPDFQSAYEAVENGDCECCVLPIENSYAGEVGQVLDLMYFGSLYVNGVYDLPVKQNLLGVKGARLSDIRTVISHPQALSQCSVYIREHNFKAVGASNTAVAARDVAAAGDKSVAAIASKETARLYDMELLDHDINESAVNTTRFAVFSKTAKEQFTENDSFILLFTVMNESGALAKALNIICAHGFNMNVLRSRPIKDKPWAYYFYMVAEGDRNSDEGRRMLNELSVCCADLKVAGHYAETISLED